MLMEQPYTERYFYARGSLMNEENYTLMPLFFVNPAGPAGGFLPTVGLEHLTFQMVEGQ
jgi:hypothetical protein